VNYFAQPASVHNKPPRQKHYLIINLPNIPSFPNLISQFLIDQQDFDVDFGEHSGH
jgi:hypothetical protein